MSELGFECTDEQFKELVDNENTDEARVAILVSEIYSKSVRVAHDTTVVRASDDVNPPLVPSQAYLGCIQSFFRHALENEGIARHFYDSLEDTCPYCANLHASMLGLKLDSDVTTMLENAVSVAGGINKDISVDAMVYVARHASLVLVQAILAEGSAACVGGSASCGKSILELTQSGSTRDGSNQNLI